MHRSSGEKAAIAVLVSILIVFLALFGLVFYANGPGLCGAFGPAPCPSRESLNMRSYTMSSPTNVTLKIINSGSAAASLASYYVRNSNGQAYTTTKLARTHDIPFCHHTSQHHDRWQPVHFYSRQLLHSNYRDFEKQPVYFHSPSLGFQEDIFSRESGRESEETEGGEASRLLSKTAMKRLSSKIPGTIIMPMVVSIGAPRRHP